MGWQARRAQYQHILQKFSLRENSVQNSDCQQITIYRKTIRKVIMRRVCHIVLTTIRHPAILGDLLDNITRHGQLENVKVWVVGDKKTPASAGQLAREVSQKGLETTYFDITAQDEWGK